jgi:hypothetical protein
VKSVNSAGSCMSLDQVSLGLNMKSFFLYNSCVHMSKIFFKNLDHFIRSSIISFQCRSLSVVKDPRYPSPEFKS